MTVKANWRIIFRFEEGHVALNLDLILRMARLGEVASPSPVNGGRLRPRQSEYRNSADLPHPPGCRADDRDLRSPAGTGRSVIGWHRPAQPEPTTPEQHQNADWLPDPQFWVLRSETSFPTAPYLLAFKDVTAPTNVRSMIAALIPGSGVGNTLPIVSTDGQAAVDAAIMLANFNAIPFDYVARQKIQGQHLNWFIVEQLPVVPPDRYEAVRFGPKPRRPVRLSERPFLSWPTLLMTWRPSPAIWAMSMRWVR